MKIINSYLPLTINTRDFSKNLFEKPSIEAEQNSIRLSKFNAQSKYLSTVNFGKYDYFANPITVEKVKEFIGIFRKNAGKGGKAAEHIKKAYLDALYELAYLRGEDGPATKTFIAQYQDYIPKLTDQDRIDTLTRARETRARLVPQISGSHSDNKPSRSFPVG